jgi:Ca-activated chloride channel family protein
MFQFQHIGYLYALALLPVFVALFAGAIYWRRKRLQQIGTPEVVERQVLGYIAGRSTTRFILMCIAFATIVIGLANLRMGDKAERTERKGVDVVIALDVSKSMLAKDIQPDRLTRAKQLIMSLTDKMSNDRVALLVFAGKSYMQVPLTIDYSALKMMLQSVSPDLVPYQGTVIAEAITMGSESFARNERKYKSLIVISDGEDHDANAVDAARKAADEGVVIHTVGVGSPMGATLYDPATRSAKLDEQGNPVVTKLNEDALKEVAAAGRGTYSLLDNTDGVAAKLNSALESMEQKNLGGVMFTDYTSYFQYFLLVGALLLLVEWLLPGARNGQRLVVNKQASE